MTPDQMANLLALLANLQNTVATVLAANADLQADNAELRDRLDHATGCARCSVPRGDHSTNAQACDAFTNA